METMIILAIVCTVLIVAIIKSNQFDRTVPLQLRIHPQAATLYDEVIYNFYPDTLVRDQYPLPGMKERALRKEDEEKFKCFLGKVAQDAGATTFTPRMLSGWPDETIVQASRSMTLVELAWQTIKDCPPQFLNTAFISSKASPHRRSAL